MLFFLTAFILSTSNATALFTNLETKRRIKLAGNLTVITTELFIRSNSFEPVSSYEYLVATQFKPHLIKFVASMLNTEQDSDIVLKTTEIETENKEYASISLHFSDTPINNEEERTFVIEEFYYSLASPLPSSISIKDDQFLKLSLTINNISCYPSEKQITQVILPFSNSQLK